ncbi:AglZ/HisF2 family acetamidino modification protein [Massilia sp. AB1]|uniref:AglZ/HisF2 family acetamidino modification protein n=1 Tax=Massilia sp. AB1 TaxID=2823371 RepID=UPI001B82354F|nr:AglZ/HisF2 family acetamidino modification protein [Massilia sp. AB1]MBQ5939637.1 imidazole glycerol phosphate synthase subunit HisF [Massilia sp. AB1]
MLNNRVIPTLLLQNGGLVKTRKFKNPKYVGDPVNAIRIFNEKEVDELIVLDIQASKQGREPDFALINEIAGECFMPLCYGGGVRTLDAAARIFDCGVEKICLQSAAMENPALITQIANRFGSQAVVLSVDIKRDWLRRTRLYNARTGANESRGWTEFMRIGVEAGAGEVMLNAVDNDGELGGYDIDSIRQACGLVEVPLIAAGGAGKLEDFKAAIEAGASAVSAGALFVFHGPHRAVLITYPRYEDLEKIVGAKK